MNTWAAKLAGGATFLGVTPLPQGLPMEAIPLDDPNIVKTIAGKVNWWNNRTYKEFTDRRIQPGYITQPVPPPMVNARPGIAFISPVLGGLIGELQKWPTVTFTGYGQTAHIRRKRNAYRDPTNYSMGPINAGPETTFGRGPGVGVNKWGANLPSFIDMNKARSIRINYEVPANDLYTVGRARNPKLGSKKVGFSGKAVISH